MAAVVTFSILLVVPGSTEKQFVYKFHDCLIETQQNLRSYRINNSAGCLISNQYAK